MSLAEHQAAVQAAVGRVMRARAARIEAACEQALTTPPAGVGVMVCHDDAWPDARVQWGVIADVSACPQVIDDPEWRSAGWKP